MSIISLGASIISSGAAARRDLLAEAEHPAVVLVPDLNHELRAQPDVDALACKDPRSPMSLSGTQERKNA